MSQLGQYFVDAGTILQIVFKATWAQETGSFLVTVGTALIAGQGSVGPIRIGSDEITVSVAPYQGH